ncbi:ABC transporter permease [Corynebacterium liangguodongii]|uniref:Peptide ABC transporter permease n=1 Tax=Corynebacterium liangguodongii TaxID=2079535 RepID=A0A2S0WFE0_9CORY|nr:ABC transporter permease [Corynebacterium liangguodongii]AWB84491.1 peptide ABC transporter permease [Corynebacterium liangguodongii]PWB98709.1 ABC transporter permease [Corynebacterium liangguodongii]
MRLLRSASRTQLVGLAMVLVVLGVAALAAVWTPYDPLQAAPESRLQGPSAAHWMGTDQLGRDILSRVMDGARLTLLVALCAVALSALIGVPLGMWAGMRRGPIEAAMMRVSDLLMAFPALLLAIVFTAVFGASALIVVMAIGIAGVPGFARMARVGTLQVMSQDYILAARVSKVPPLQVARTHVLPNIVPMTIVQVSVSLAMAILAEAGLSFLGLGTPAPYASWGRMLQASQPYLATDAHLALWPGLAIACTVMGFTLLGGDNDQR